MILYKKNSPCFSFFFLIPVSLAYHLACIHAFVILHYFHHFYIFSERQTEGKGEKKREREKKEKSCKMLREQYLKRYLYLRQEIYRNIQPEIYNNISHDHYYFPTTFLSFCLWIRMKRLRSLKIWDFFSFQQFRTFSLMIDWFPWCSLLFYFWVRASYSFCRFWQANDDDGDKAACLLSTYSFVGKNIPVHAMCIVLYI